ncbi:hypothetical protein A8C56_15740 [Niabella ginsenosidivorans]|uniref:DUF1016 domain-containing protein n=1 Tax=Niabella ginsenosidivorans TaxID=1176587 RepID=A0A1A9I685_9BACT|nr:PDDEXK nuclease domain-containing protein [Niabella ginsenosidivorans]ANH82220.1 hypothetical protein A8C56_15740 [Niabella ginsenosidivorans]
MEDKIQLSGYGNWLKDLKQQIKNSRIKAVLVVNSQLILLYWDLGRQIVEKQERSNWGSGFISQLSKDLQAEFPDMGGWSKTNLFNIRNFYLFYKDVDFQQTKVFQQVVGIFKKNESVIVQQAVGSFEKPEDAIAQQLVSQLALIPWGHHILIIQKIKNVSEALFYVNKTIENNWSRSVLEYQMEINLYQRQGKAVSNFTTTLPQAQGDLANELLKDPYNFEFLQLSEKVREADLEKSLVDHISRFLLELGKGFAYMGRQYLLKIGKKEYRTDLLFYHTRLKCYIIIELKTKGFEPEFIGKLNYYISAINELIKDAADNPTIGILLCKNKDNYDVEFALKDINKPIGVSSYRYTELAEEIQRALPSAEEIEYELKKFEQNNE